MSYRNARRVAGFIILLLSLIILLWGVWPQVSETLTVPFEVPDAENPSTQLASTSTNALMNDRRDDAVLTLSWPTWVRVGDSGLIQLKIAEVREMGGVLDRGKNQPPVMGELAASGEENSLIEGRLEISGMLAIPFGEIYEPYQPGGRAAFFWNVQPEQVGIFDGFLWLHLSRFIDGNSLSDPMLNDGRSLITAQRIQIQTVDLFGLDGPTARLIGVIGIALGILLWLEDILPKLIRQTAKESRA